MNTYLYRWLNIIGYKLLLLFGLKAGIIGTLFSIIIRVELVYIEADGWFDNVMDKKMRINKLGYLLRYIKIFYLYNTRSFKIGEKNNK